MMIVVVLIIIHKDMIMNVDPINQQNSFKIKLFIYEITI